MNAAQLSFLDELFGDDRKEMLTEFCRRGSGWSGGRVRIWAMFESGQWPQYRHLWLKDEFGIGGHSMEGKFGWFADYNSTGVKIRNLRERVEHSYTWKEVVRAFEELIADGELLNRLDQREIAVIAQQYDGKLPYPRPRMAYPTCAWGFDDTPIWRTELIKA